MKIQGLEEPNNPGASTSSTTPTQEEPNNNPGGGGGGGSTTSSTSPPPSPGGPEEDRISELPVEILHRILGFLEMDEFLIGTSLVSTKWRNLWKSVSTLNFPKCTITRRIVGGGGGIVNNEERYQNFVDRVLTLRNSQASKIRIFSHYCVSKLMNYDDLEVLHKSIVGAANQGAQEIEILTGRYSKGKRDEKIHHKSNSSRIILLNPSIFTSGELRKFTFQLFSRNFRIQLPPSMCSATHLTLLKLNAIILPKGDDDDDSNIANKLRLNYPVLDRLVLHRCYYDHLKVLDISAPRLKFLSISNTGMRKGRHFDGLGGCRLEIHNTPNLTSFDYSGCVFVDCFMEENLPRVDSACLTLRKETGMVEETTSFATKLLKGLTSAQSLTLKGFEVFSQDTLRDLLTPFTSLTDLSLTSSSNTSSIYGMVHFLNSCNSIEQFVWDMDEFSTVEDDEDEHLMIPQQCRLSHLKHVCIKNLRGHENEIEFVKFLLKSSIVLEEIIIYTAKDSPKISIEENLKQFIEKEPLFRSIKLKILLGGQA